MKFWKKIRTYNNVENMYFLRGFFKNICKKTRNPVPIETIS